LVLPQTGNLLEPYKPQLVESDNINFQFNKLFIDSRTQQHQSNMSAPKTLQSQNQGSFASEEELKRNNKVL